ncbi:MAG TPA: hypothetical protein VFQ38_04245 [Longimicrobiales bacterium]|nr:hypothetical protein [Longimicrobiales bacterium]
MADQIQVIVYHGDRAFPTVVRPDERADELLLRSVYHFGIDPEEKGDFLLRHRGARRGEGNVILDHPAGDQLRDGDLLELDRDTPDVHHISTGHY